MEIPIVVAILGVIGVLASATMSAVTQRNVKQLEERFKKHQQVTTFLNDQLSKLYLPVSMHLRATRALANTHYEADNATKTEIEHALWGHNKVILEHLLTNLMYLDPGAPEVVTTELLEHLLQWENVYKLKYEHKRHTGPIWDGIRDLGYRQFPDEAADHFHKRAKEIRVELHARLQSGI